VKFEFCVRVCVDRLAFSLVARVGEALAFHNFIRHRACCTYLVTGEE
jgi:hypothetical protein